MQYLYTSFNHSACCHMKASKWLDFDPIVIINMILSRLLVICHHTDSICHYSISWSCEQWKSIAKWLVGCKLVEKPKRHGRRSMHNTGIKSLRTVVRGLEWTVTENKALNKAKQIQTVMLNKIIETTIADAIPAHIEGDQQYWHQ